MSATYLILHGPPMSGKTLNSEALKRHYKCDHVFDGGFDDARIAGAKGRVMVLTCDANIKGPRGHRKMFKESVRIPVQEAVVMLGRRWVAPRPAAAVAAGKGGSK